jgi:hypothetical protein
MTDSAGGRRSMRHPGSPRAGARPVAVGGTVCPGPVAGQHVTPAAAGDAGREAGRTGLEVVLAAAAFAVLCVAVLSVAPQLVEPDDYAYRGSILAITQGHLLTLSAAQARDLAAQLAHVGPVTPSAGSPAPPAPTSCLSTMAPVGGPASSTSTCSTCMSGGTPAAPTPHSCGRRSAPGGTREAAGRSAATSRFRESMAVPAPAPAPPKARAVTAWIMTRPDPARRS